MQTTYTDAPALYDGFGTKTVRLVGRTSRGTVRQVETPDDHATWQRQRYASGGVYLYATTEELPRVQSLIEPLPGGPITIHWLRCPNCEREQQMDSPNAVQECRNCGYMLNG